MELPQPRPFKTQGRKPTHDFLSLCSHSTVHPDPKPTPPPSSQGSHLKTHDFLQPLECVGAKEDVSRINSTTTASEKPPPPAPPPPLQHVLPGGIGTYTISPIPYFHHHHQRIPKPELSPPMMFNANERNVLDENSNSNCSSYAAASSGFTLCLCFVLFSRDRNLRFVNFLLLAAFPIWVLQIPTKSCSRTLLAEILI